MKELPDEIGWEVYHALDEHKVILEGWDFFSSAARIDQLLLWLLWALNNDNADGGRDDNDDEA